MLQTSLVDCLKRSLLASRPLQIRQSYRPSSSHRSTHYGALMITTSNASPKGPVYFRTSILITSKKLLRLGGRTG